MRNEGIDPNLRAVNAVVNVVLDAPANLAPLNKLHQQHKIDSHDNLPCGIEQPSKNRAHLEP